VLELSSSFLLSLVEFYSFYLSGKAGSVKIESVYISFPTIFSIVITGHIVSDRVLHCFHIMMFYRVRREKVEFVASANAADISKSPNSV
jgi:hypothetical protein